MLPARQFFMIRHGETVMNAQRRACGWFDTELNDEGRHQAYVASQVLEALPDDQRPTLMIHSGLTRTIDTASILNANLKLPMLVEPDLREHNIGEWEGKAWDEVFPLLRADVKPEGGETRHEFAERVRVGLTRHLKDHLSERILFVGHGGLFHSFQLMHQRERRIFIQNATLHRFDPEPAHHPLPWRITLYDWKNALREGPAPICPSMPDTPSDLPWDKAHKK